MVKKNAIISTKDCWSLSRLPAPWNTLVPKKDYEGVLLNEFHNSSFKHATLLSYVVEAVIADAANEMLGGEPCLIEFTASDASESWYGAEAENRMDPSGDKGKLIASCKNQGGVLFPYIVPIIRRKSVRLRLPPFRRTTKRRRLTTSCLCTCALLPVCERPSRPLMTSLCWLGRQSSRGAMPLTERSCPCTAFLTWCITPYLKRSLR